MNKKDFYFLVNWALRKERTWSGTCWNIYKAIIDENPNIICKDLTSGVVAKILNRFFNPKDFDINFIKKKREKFNKYLSNKKITNVLQFQEVVTDTSLRKTFIYVDAVVSFVKYLQETDPKLYEAGLCTFNIGSITTLNERAILQNEYFSQCAGIFTMSHWLKDFIISHKSLFGNNFDESKVHYVGAGANINTALIDNSKKNGNKFLFVGRDFERKGGYLVYKAFSELKKEYREIELHIAGPAKNPIENPIDGYYFHGDCSYDETAKLFNLCDVFCMPSYFEAFGLVFVEALSFGLPCIGRKAFEMPYFIQDGVTGYLIENDNVNYLAEKMMDLLTNKRIRQNVVQNQQYYLQEYSWKTTAKRILSVMQE